MFDGWIRALHFIPSLRLVVLRDFFAKKLQIFWRQGKAGLNVIAKCPVTVPKERYGWAYCSMAGMTFHE